MQHLADLEKGLAKCEGVLSEAQLRKPRITASRIRPSSVWPRWTSSPWKNYRAGFKMVDTCAAEFSANTPYFLLHLRRRQRSRRVHRGEGGQGRREGRAQEKESPRLRLRPYPHRSGHRVRLLLCPLRLDPQEARLRGYPRQQQNPRRSPPTSTPATACISTR